MPNHITTICTATGAPAQLDRFTAAHIRKKEDGRDWFDLATVIPVPACVDGTESGSEADAGFYALTGLIHNRFLCLPPFNPATHYVQRGFHADGFVTHEHFRDWLAEHAPEVLAKGEKSLQCFRETGHRGWYDWNVANWGTKWNSYDYAQRSREPERFVFKFETANGFPGPVFEKLAELFPELTFEVVTIDEGGPEFEGRYAGVERTFERKEHSAERYRFVYGSDPYTDDGDDAEADEALH